MQPQRYFRLLKLKINIRDINDNAPSFPRDVIIVNVSENANPNDVINLNQYQAQDLDAGTTLLSVCCLKRPIDIASVLRVRDLQNSFMISMTE